MAVTDEQAKDIEAQRQQMQQTLRVTVPALEEILYQPLPVLDHGFVRVVDYMGADESVVQAARVSYGRGTKKVSDDRGLIRYLMRHMHTTPFEMCDIKLHVKLPIFVARQWIRHRTACLAEGTRICFDLPGGMRRGGRQSYKLKIEDLYKKFRPTANRTQPSKQRNPLFRAERVKAMCLRQMNEDTGVIQHTRVVNVYKNGVKPVFRMVLDDGKGIECTSDHQFLFSDGWKTLKQATGLRLVHAKAAWLQKSTCVYVNGLTVEQSAPDQDRTRQKRPRVPWNKLTVGKLVQIREFHYVGEKETYDVEVEGPYHNFVANGIVTHNSVNEYSARYSILDKEFYLPQQEVIGVQDSKNRQGRGKAISAEKAKKILEILKEDALMTYKHYEEFLGLTSEVQEDEPLARELARINLPVSFYTQWYWKIDLHNFFHFLQLRLDDHAQYEIRAYGEVMAGIMQRWVPLCWEAFTDYRWKGLRLSRLEIAVIRKLLAGEEPRDEAKQLSKREREELQAKLGIDLTRLV